MNPTPLDLKDIHEPIAVGDWPPAMGWWILAITIPLLIMLAIWIYKRLSRKTALKTAKKLLVELKQDTTRDNSAMLGELSVLFRRVALSVAPREKVAGLTGSQWLTYLDSSVKNKPFSEGIGQLLVNGPYRKTPVTELELSQLIDLCSDWLKAQEKP
jgi:hypothetical protein